MPEKIIKQRKDMLQGIDNISLDENIFECFEIDLKYMEDCDMENLRAFQAVSEYKYSVKELKHYPEIRSLCQRSRQKKWQPHRDSNSD